MNRIVLFLATNLAVVAVLAVVLNVLGFNRPGANLSPLLMMAALMGMGGSFISLLLSKTKALRSTGAVVIAQPTTAQEQWLVATVRRQADRLGLGMPDVAMFNSESPNAFATGSSRNHSRVAVSSGLLARMPAARRSPGAQKMIAALERLQGARCPAAWRRQGLPVVLRVGSRVCC